MKNLLENELPSYSFIQAMVNYERYYQGTNKIYVFKHLIKQENPDLFYYLKCLDDKLLCIKILDSAVQELSPLVFNEIKRNYGLKSSDLIMILSSEYPLFYVVQDSHFDKLTLSSEHKELILYRIKEYNKLVLNWHNF